jgi:hypothetical protein
MKIKAPYIILLIVLVAAIGMIFFGKDKTKQFDDRLSFRIKDKIPYGYWVAYNNLKHIFPAATISTDIKEPGYWDSLSVYDNKQALLIFSPYFFPNEDELDKLMNFVKSGNDIFISSIFLNEVAQDRFGFNSSYFDYSYLRAGRSGDDTLRLSLQSDPEKEKEKYEYPGRRVATFMSQTNDEVTYILGRDDFNRPNFIRMRSGKGHIYIHTAPLAFSNYFLLYKNNIHYYESVLSWLPGDIKQVVWDEYYLFKRDNNQENEEDKKGFMSVLLGFKEFRWAFFTALILLVLYVLNEMRRKQRYIPVMKKPLNDSMEFVKTIGRLYFEKADHRNLCRKMSGYFLDHIRTRYNISVANRNEEFINAVSYKTGYPADSLRSIVNFINNVETISITDTQLKDFHRSLEDFYSKI